MILSEWLFLEAGLDYICLCAQSDPTLCKDPCTVSYQSSDHNDFPSKDRGWIAISHSRGSSLSRDLTHVSCISCVGGQILDHSATWGFECITLSYPGFWCSKSSSLIDDISVSLTESVCIKLVEKLSNLADFILSLLTWFYRSMAEGFLFHVFMIF